MESGVEADRSCMVTHVLLLTLQLRSNEKKAKAGKYVKKVKAKQRRKTHLAANPLQADELADVWED